VIKIPCVAV